MKPRIMKTLYLVLTLLGGCSYTYRSLNPRPQALVSAEYGAISCDVIAVTDTQHPNGRVTVENFRQSLRTGFQNAAREYFVPPGTAGASTLVIDQADLEVQHVGTIGVVTVRVRARWVNSAGQTISEHAGIAAPRNPLSTGQRHIEDTLEVMFEELFLGLRDALNEGRRS